jgi:hypothetical protein
MYAVIGILIVLAVAYFLTSLPAPTPKTTETFADITIPSTIAPPPPVVEQAVVGANKPGQLASAPYQQIARNSPLPYQNPALTKTTRQRILTVLELLKDFLTFSANEIEYRSDPKIQLPLTTLRGDFQRLSDEANVIQRNPGLDPDLTDSDLDEIQANYDYLQREVNLIGANRPFENKSVQKTLRKPIDQLKEFKAAGKVALRKFLDDINATDTKMNGRINEETILLKVQ